MGSLLDTPGKEKEINMKPTSSKMALEPYLEAVKGHSERFSQEELTTAIIEPAQDVPMGARGESLGKIRALAPHFPSPKREGDPCWS